MLTLVVSSFFSTLMCTIVTRQMEGEEGKYSIMQNINEHFSFAPAHISDSARDRTKVGHYI